METVKPPSGLVNCLANVVSREPSVLNDILVLKRIVPLSIRHRSRVEPSVHHFGYAFHEAVTVRAIYKYGVHKWSMEVEIIYPMFVVSERHILQLFHTAHTMMLVA